MALSCLTLVSAVDKKTCQAGCAKVCSRIFPTLDYRCKACKRGFVRSVPNFPSCDTCAVNWGTVIDPGLPRGLKRTFLSCKQVPCRKCWPCPKGTYSVGGTLGPAVGTDSTCYALLAPQSFTQVIKTTPTPVLPISCSDSDGLLLAALVKASLQQRQGLNNIKVTYKPPCAIADAGTAYPSAAYTIDIFFAGPGGPLGAKAQIEAASAQQILMPPGFAGGVCDAYPKAAGDLSICEAYFSNQAPPSSGNSTTPSQPSALGDKFRYILGSSLTPADKMVPAAVIAQQINMVTSDPSCTSSDADMITGLMMTSFGARPESGKNTATSSGQCFAQTPAASDALSTLDGAVAALPAGGGEAAVQSGEGVKPPVEGLEASLQLPYDGNTTLQFFAQNVLGILLGNTANNASATTQAVMSGIANDILSLSQVPDQFDIAYLLPGNDSFRGFVFNATGMFILNAIPLDPINPLSNNTAGQWSLFQQTIVSTAYENACTQAAGDAIAAAVAESFALQAGAGIKYLSIKYAGVCTLNAAVNPPTAAYTILGSYLGSSQYAQSIYDASKGPFAVCNAFPAQGNGSFAGLCPSFQTSVQPEQILCATGGDCPPPCPEGTFRNYQQVPNCDFALGGWYEGANNGSMQKCPEETFVPLFPARDITKDQAPIGTCGQCPKGQSTNWTEGNSNCDFVRAGYFWTQPSGPAAECDANTFTTVIRAIADVPDVYSCTSCQPTETTFGETGWITCSAIPNVLTVPAGHYWNLSGVSLCPEDTFAPSPRPVAEALSCTACPNLYAQRSTDATGQLQLLEASGVADRLSCKCPENTYSYFDTAKDGNTTNWACAPCPTGSTGPVGNPSKEGCRANCQAGYYGDPRDMSYNFECFLCPISSFGNARSATTATNKAPVEATKCDSCVWDAGESAVNAAPAVCLKCEAGYWRSPSLPSACNNCASGFKPEAGKCVKCPANFAINTNWTSPAKTDANGSCGACAAGVWGDTCATKCPYGKRPQDGVPSETWVLPLDPLLTVDNCIWGCAPGKGWNSTAKDCFTCTGVQYSPGATPTNPRPVCIPCPTGTLPDATTRSRCVTSGGAALPEGFFDEFD